MARRLIKQALWMLTALGAYLIYQLAFLVPEFVENIYSRVIYPILTYPIGFLSSLLPFSLGEFLLYGFILFVVFWVFFTFAALFRKKGRRVYTFFRRLISLGIAFCMVYFVFVMGWGLNYARQSLSETMNLSVQEATPEELAQLCTKLAEQANGLRVLCLEDQDGVFTLSHSREAILTSVDALYQEEAPEEFTKGIASRAKGVAFPDLLSTFETAGIFSPFTYEPNVNMQMPDLFFPSTVAHEYAHLKGIAREDEANFMAWYVCFHSENVDFAYSGTMLALTYATNALYDVNTSLYRDVIQQLDDGVLRDLLDHNDYWAEFDTEFSEGASEIYDAYLEANRVEDGAQSYGRMVDLILAMERQGLLGQPAALGES